VELREEEKKGLLRLREAEPLRREICATTGEILPAEIGQVSRDVRRRDPPEARFLFLSFFLSPFVSPSPRRSRRDIRNFKRTPKRGALTFPSAFGIFARLIRSRLFLKIARTSTKFVQTEKNKLRLLFVSSLPSTFMMIIRRAGGCSIERPFELVHRVSFEFTSRDALTTAIFISWSFSTRSITWYPEPGGIHFSSAGFAADSKNHAIAECRHMRAARHECSLRHTFASFSIIRVN